MHAPDLIAPAQDLRCYLEGGGLFTPWAERRCGQQVSADVENAGPVWLSAEEARLLGVAPAESCAALRRGGSLVQADGTAVGRVTSVVSVGRARQVLPDLIRTLNTTRTPLGTIIGEHGKSEVLWCSEGICEYAVACGRVIHYAGTAVALTTDWVLWSWLGAVAGNAAEPRPS